MAALLVVDDPLEMVLVDVLIVRVKPHPVFCAKKDNSTLPGRVRWRLARLVCLSHIT